MQTRKRPFVETSSSNVCKGASAESNKQIRLDDDQVSEDCTSKASVVTSEAVGTAPETTGTECSDLHTKEIQPSKQEQTSVQNTQDDSVKSNQGSSFSTLSSSESSGSNNTPEIAGNPNTRTTLSAAPTKSSLTEVLPLKSTKMIHLRTKYMSQLEYMHREFKKLERQLLGAKTTAKNLTESAGSKERREKLHNFIVHLEDTINQVQMGCSLEEQGKSTVGVTVPSSGDMTIDQPQQKTSELKTQDVIEELSAEEEEAKKEFARSSALTKLTRAKEEEESVQKLEEHILANLLPVKERLAKQLAAQQGATKNPVGMPVNRRGLQPPGISKQATSSHHSGVTSTANATLSTNPECSRGPLHPSSSGPSATISQYGQPLGGGSSLTQKLHGKTLGSTTPRSSNIDGETSVNSKNISVNQSERKVIYAGMTPGSRQVQSGVSAAAGVHDLVIENETYKKPNSISSTQPSATVSIPPPPPEPQSAAVQASLGTTRPIQTPGQNSIGAVTLPYRPAPVVKSGPVPVKGKTVPPVNSVTRPMMMKKVAKEPMDTSQVRQRIGKIDTNVMQKTRQKSTESSHFSVAAPGPSTRQISKSAPISKASNTGQKKGPTTVEYMCALCNETYKATSEYNPWWALQSHECAKCGKTQIPRLDISAPANAIDYHPALLVHAACEDSSKIPSKATPSIPNHYSLDGNENSQDGSAKVSSGFGDLAADLDFDLSDEDDEIMLGVDDEDDGGGDDDDSVGISSSARAENEDFGKNYDGPVFTEYDASRLLILMSHASTCPGQHKNDAQKDICLNTKLMMMHVRDCPGTTATFDVCPYPWCRKTKHLLYHLVSCEDPGTCHICSPIDISYNLRALKGLNEFRKNRIKERFCTPVANDTSSTTDTTQSKSSGLMPETGNLVTGKKSIGPKRAQKMTSVPSRMIKPMVPVPSKQNHSLSKMPLSVPSPIPQIGEDSSSGLLKIHPATKAGGSLCGQAVKKPTTTVPANPLLTSNDAVISNATSKMSSPPNPLKGLPRDSPTDNITRPKSISQFPTLPTQIRSDESRADQNGVGIKAEEIQ